MARGGYGADKNKSLQIAHNSDRLTLIRSGQLSPHTHTVCSMVRPAMRLRFPLKFVHKSVHRSVPKSVLVNFFSRD